MTETDFFLWVKGPAFHVATVVFVVGVLVRIVEILALGRAPDLAEPKGNATLAGFRVTMTRMIPKRGTITKRSAFTEIGGWIFHVGMLLVIFFSAPHILVFKEILGFGWPSLPTPLIDALTAISIIAMIAVGIHRLLDPVLRLLSRFQDYLALLVTMLPLLTGFLAYHHALLPYTTMLAIHILSVELLMVVFPFTKLMHAFTLFFSRYYNGATQGYKGVGA
jgi:nitrate reductase gamma subunit